MAKIDTTASSPMLIRTYKKEAELKIWKMKSDGQYALLKTFPICRWSGQLGPKRVEGDMQVPEGFYAIAPGQMNPNSHYYLAFNVGYPNAYDRAYGRTGGSVMVHGVCSSAGCFSMTDKQVDDIYAIARDALRGGQREIQLQSYPFHMTPENMAKYRLDPNIAFWKELKNGADHFEVTLDRADRPHLQQALHLRGDRQGRSRGGRAVPGARDGPGGRAAGHGEGGQGRRQGRRTRRQRDEGGSGPPTPTAGRTRSSPATRTRAIPTPSCRPQEEVLDEPAKPDARRGQGGGVRRRQAARGGHGRAAKTDAGDAASAARGRRGPVRRGGAAGRRAAPQPIAVPPAAAGGVAGMWGAGAH